MKTQEVNIDEEFAGAVQTAQKIFFAGGVFAYPTDTIYGFGANPFNKEAVDKISAIKQRDDSKRYIYLAGDIQTVLKYTNVQQDCFVDFLLSIWPNPVTVILPVKKEYSGVFNTETIGFRIPNHTFCLKLLSAIKMPLISTSINRSGQEPLNEYSQIAQEFTDEVDALFYSVKKQFTRVSTVISLASGQLELVREGRVHFNEIITKFEDTRK